MEVLPEAHGRSSKQHEPPENLQKEVMENGRREAFGSGLTTLRPPPMRDPFSQRLPLFYSSRREPFTSLTIYLPNITTYDSLCTYFSILYIKGEHT